jgi:LysR family transcriptional regulator, glycine cleavage system transcriptional activator
VRALVREGAGVAVLPRYYVEDDLTQGKLVQLVARTKLPSDWFRLVWRTGHARDRELRELAGELAQRGRRKTQL